ncbi:MAG: sugar phosphate isomerase/epimerase [Clostridiales bacterium]|nr:sugar phosphate isomerase/epimerase [Clostridiales bacterium]
MSIKEFSIQLYTLRDLMKDDFAGVLAKVGKLGFTGVEFAGYGGYSAKELKKILDDSGLKSVGSHVPYDAITKDTGAVIEYNAILGSEWIVCPHANMATRDDALRAAESFEKPAEKIAEAGIGFAYHNHHFEFAKSGESFLLDILLENTDNKLVFSELDMYWAAYAGVDPLEYLAKLGGRAKLLHVKQMKDFETKRCIDLGEGAIDFKKVLRVGAELGVLHYILEQEEFESDPLVSAKNGIDYIFSI